MENLAANLAREEEKTKSLKEFFDFKFEVIKSTLLREIDDLKEQQKDDEARIKALEDEQKKFHEMGLKALFSSLGVIAIGAVLSAASDKTRNSMAGIIHFFAEALK